MTVSRSKRGLLLAVVAAGLVACDEPGIRSYEAPKDAPRPTSAAAPAMRSNGPTPPSARGSGAAGFAWQLPPGWRESNEPRQMRVATFVAGEGDESLDIALSAFPEDVGGALANLNRWRGQLGLAPVEADAVDEQMKPLTPGKADDGVLLDLSGQAQHGSAGVIPMRMLVAMVPDRDRTWFLKVMGRPEEVEAQREAFVQFARTLPPTSATSPSAPAASAAGATRDPAHSHAASHWTPPAHWQIDPNPNSMLKAAYIVPDEHGPVRVTVMSLPGDGGGTLPNLNRWRNQVGLAPVATVDEQPMERLAVDGQPAAMIDLAGVPDGAATRQRMVVALVTRPRETWFIKMSGDEDAVANHANDFRSFVESVHFH